MTHPQPDDSLVISYLGLRKGIGIIGTGLPFALVVGNLLMGGPGLQGSISAFYYTGMRDVLVGSMCAIAIFLLSYHGYDWRDDLAGDVACVSALGVALFPTAPGVGASATDQLIGYIHFISAAILFLTLAYFSLALFRKTDPTRSKTEQKEKRNIVYTICGYTILACIALLLGASLLPEGSAIDSLNPVFWLEAIAILAFGISWLTKGEAILADRERGHAGGGTVPVESGIQNV